MFSVGCDAHDVNDCIMSAQPRPLLDWHDVGHNLSFKTSFFDHLSRNRKMFNHTTVKHVKTCVFTRI